MPNLHQHSHSHTRHRRQLSSNLRLRPTNDQGLLFTTHHLQRKRMGSKRKMKFPKPCLDCGTLSLGNRCPTHQQAVEDRHNIRRAIIKQTTGQYSGNYQRLAKIIRQTTIICAICGDGARHNDPWQADHKDPSTPVDNLDQLQGVHASCNRAKSNKPQP